MNMLWEMAAAERILHGVLEGARGLINGVTCGAGMPYRIAEICAHYGVHYYPIVSSARAFRALWKRAYHKFRDWIGGVVYEDPWLAGGHNGLSNSEDPAEPEPPFPRVRELRKLMREFGLDETPIIMAGGVWCLREWEDWIDNPELGPIAFQFGTRPLLTKESPISDAWKRKLLTLKEGDVYLNHFSPTGFYSSAVRNNFLNELARASERQVAYSIEPVGDHLAPLEVGARRRIVYLTPHDRERALIWIGQGFTEALRTPDSTLIFVASPKGAGDPRRSDQLHGLSLGAASSRTGRRTRKARPARKPTRAASAFRRRCRRSAIRTMCEVELMFAGHNAYRFARDPYYANGFIPTVRELVDRLRTGN